MAKGSAETVIAGDGFSINRTPENVESVGLYIFDCNIRVDYDDQELSSYILNCYSAFVSQEIHDEVDKVIAISRCADNNGWKLRHGTIVVKCEYYSDIVYSLEKAITIILQELRSDLYFIHGAAIGHGEQCTLIVGASGAGKSTLCLDLCSLGGYDYISDELAPVDPRSMQVVPYPHALCLKARPDKELVADYLSTEHTFHVPAESLPVIRTGETPGLQNILFLENSSSAPAGLEAVKAAEAASRLYANGLNQLAHERLGLAAAASITKACRCFKMIRSDRQTNVEIVTSLLSGII